MSTKELPESTVAIFNDGDSAIVVDDNCYVIRNWNGTKWGYSAWIFKEALEIIKSLPETPNEALILSK